MSFKHIFLAFGLISLVTGSGLAQAGEARPAPPTEVQMEAVRACAAAKGVEMPAPPAKGEKPPEGAGAGKGPHGGPPKMTDAQRAIIDACFKQAGLEPPKGPPPGGKGGHGGPGGSRGGDAKDAPAAGEGSGATAQ